MHVRATRGVVLGAGGFDHNAEWRREHQGVDGSASSGAAGNLGTVIAAAQRVGAAVDLMDDAWWGGSIPKPTPDGRAAFLVSERSVPHSVIVDARGERFANESESYVDLGHHLLEHAKSVPGRFWMVTDVRHARRYLRSYALDPRVTKAMRQAGILHRAETLAGLAAAIGVDAARLEATVRAVQRLRAHRASTTTSAVATRPTTATTATPGRTPTPTSGRSRRVRSPRSRSSPVTSAPRVVSSPTSTPGCCEPTARSSTGSTRPATRPPRSSAARTRVPGSTLGPACVFGHLAATHLATTPVQRDLVAAEPS